MGESFSMQRVKSYKIICVLQQGQEEEFEDYLKELIELLLKKMVCLYNLTFCIFIGLDKQKKST